MIEITLSGVTDFAALGERWQSLEARSPCSFFQGWTWTGCLAAERFPDPVLLEASSGGETVALALFNRRPGLRETLFLGETGTPRLDALFIEHNGLLAAGDAPQDLAEACLRAARAARIGAAGRPWLPRRLVLSGVAEPTLHAARRVGAVWLRRTQPAPFVDLARLRRDATDYLAGLSSGTRYQIRRSDRAYGSVQVRRAAAPAEAHAWLDELAALHQASWTARGEPGAFADPFFGRFHHALIDRGFQRGEIDLLRVSSGAHCVGFLYNFRFRGSALSYQSGFNYAEAARHQKPGLTSHHASIRFCSAAGLDRYDFLAGDDRYKRSLAGDVTPLHWVELGGGGLVRGVLAALRRRKGR